MEAPDEADDWISRITGIDFIGSGSGIAVSASNRVRTQNCYFSNWKTALLAYGNAWINTMDCVFEDNETGLYYNVTGGLHDDNRFTGNTFRSNRPLLFWRMWLQTSGWILAAACLREIRRILTTAAISPSTFRKPSSSKGVLTV